MTITAPQKWNPLGYQYGSRKGRLEEAMRALAGVTFAVVSIGIILVATIVADSAGATRADAEGYAETIVVSRDLTPTPIIAQEHAAFQR
jgi:hypothetical protein